MAWSLTLIFYHLPPSPQSFRSILILSFLVKKTIVQKVETMKYTRYVCVKGLPSSKQMKRHFEIQEKLLSLALIIWKKQGYIFFWEDENRLLFFRFVMARTVALKCSLIIRVLKQLKMIISLSPEEFFPYTVYISTLVVPIVGKFCGIFICHTSGEEYSNCSHSIFSCYVLF